MLIRPEQNEDYGAIREVVRLAFADHPRSTQNEHRIVDALRGANALTLAMVAMEGYALLGFVACSPVTIDGKRCDWVGLGPIAALPERQRQGVGNLLLRTYRIAQSAGRLTHRFASRSGLLRPLRFCIELRFDVAGRSSGLLSKLAFEY